MDISKTVVINVVVDCGLFKQKETVGGVISKS